MNLHPPLKIYLLTQNEVRGWDTYDSCVVIAANEEEAKKIHPGNFKVWNPNANCFTWPGENERDYLVDWPNDLDAITATYLGEAKLGSEPGRVCSSFKAG